MELELESIQINVFNYNLTIKTTYFELILTNCVCWLDIVEHISYYYFIL